MQIKEVSDDREEDKKELFHVEFQDMATLINSLVSMAT